MEPRRTGRSHRPAPPADRTSGPAVRTAAAPAAAVQPLRQQISEGVALPQPLSGPTLGPPCHPQALGDIEEAPPGFEPGLADLQPAA